LWKYTFVALRDLSRVVAFQWDAGNSRKNDKHGVTPEEAQAVFGDENVAMFLDTRHSSDEVRFHAFGQTAAGRLLQVEFTLRFDGTLIRVISARPMSRNERASYAKAKENPGPDSEVQN
jgi:uncharacterized DUF497 family protein